MILENIRMRAVYVIQLLSHDNLKLQRILFLLKKVERNVNLKERKNTETIRFLFW